MTPGTPTRPGSRPRGRWALALGLAAIWLPAVLVVASRIVWAPDLPDRIATHWHGWSRPDAISSTSGMFAAALTVTIVAGVVTTAAVLVRRRFPAAASAGILLGPLVAGPIAGSWLVSVWATVAAGSAVNATLGPRILLIVPALALGLVPIALMRENPARPGTHVPARALDLRPGERASWSAVLGGRIFVVTAACLTLAAVAVGLVVDHWTGVILAAAAILTAAFARTEVTADQRGLRLRSWLLGFPFKRIPLDDIAEVHTEDIDPMRWGGWGYRVAPGRSALVLRSGPGLVVERRSGALFAVTLDDPDTPASLLTALARSAPPRA
jgi:hypothetical protein